MHRKQTASTLIAILVLAGASQTSWTEALLGAEAPAVVTVDSSLPICEVSRLLMGFNIKYYLDTDERWADGKIARLMTDIKTGLLRFPKA